MGGLGAGTGGLSLRAAGAAELDVQGGDAALLAAGNDVLGGEHGRVGGRLVTVSLDLHATSDLGDSFAASGVSHVDEGVVEGREDVGNTVHDRLGVDVGAEGLDLTGALSLLAHDEQPIKYRN